MSQSRESASKMKFEDALLAHGVGGTDENGTGKQLFGHWTKRVAEEAGEGNVKVSNLRD